MTRAAVALALFAVLVAFVLCGADAFDDLEQRRPTPSIILDTTTQGDTTP